MKLALAYDWIDKWGGAERILQIIFEAFPEADIYTLYTDYRSAVWAKSYQNRIHTTFLQPLYRLLPSKQIWAPFMPQAVESLDLSAYDRVLSLSSSFIKGIITRPETKHVGYLFCPTRFLWHEFREFNRGQWLLKLVAPLLREWDFVASQKPDQLLTLSRYDRDLIRKYYRREVTILYPPFDRDYWQKLKPEPWGGLAAKSFFLFVGRLEPYKRVDLLTETFKRVPQAKLVIIGAGSEAPKIKASAGKNICFFNNVTDAQLSWLYRNAKALIMPQREDFGYTALESICLQTPVISCARSGAVEMVKHGVTGYLFPEQTVSSLLTALEKFEGKAYNFSYFNWQRTDKRIFIRKLTEYLS